MDDFVFQKRIAERMRSSGGSEYDVHISRHICQKMRWLLLVLPFFFTSHMTRQEKSQSGQRPFEFHDLNPDISDPKSYSKNVALVLMTSLVRNESLPL